MIVPIEMLVLVSGYAQNVPCERQLPSLITDLLFVEGLGTQVDPSSIPWVGEQSQ